MKRIGFVGTGKIGLPLACKLLESGCAVAVCDPDPEALRFFTERGGRYEESIGRLAAHCDILFLCLPDFRETEEIMLGPEGILAQAPAGTVVVDLGSGDPYTAERIAQAAEEKGLSYLDASVDGGIGEAAEGTLTVMVGGPPAAYREIEGVLRKIARNVFHMGASGAGQKAKVIHAAIYRAHLAVLCEALVLGMRAGLEPAQIMTVITAGAAESRVSRRYGPLLIKDDRPTEDDAMMDHRYLEHMRAMERATQTALPLAGLVSQLIVAAENRGLSAGNISAVRELYEELARNQSGLSGEIEPGAASHHRARIGFPPGDGTSR